MITGYIAFARKETGAVLYGWLLTFFSSFGQTFLISLYVPFLLSELSITKSFFGSAYALATVIASGFLLRFGHLVDQMTLRPLTNRVVLLLLLSCILLGLVVHPAMLLLALLGLRLGGQGLMTHLSMSVMSRQFDRDRGKALSLSSLGYPMGEMFFPLLLGGIIAFGGWRTGAFASATMVGMLLFLFRGMALEALDLPIGLPPENQVGKRKFYWDMIREKRFWILSLPSLANGFVATGFFFYQFVMAESKGWPLAVYTSIFAGYGGVRFVFSLFGGSFTDRFSAVKIFPYYLLPFTAGLFALAIIPGIAGAVVFLLLTGVSMGAAAVVQSAVIAELYGVNQIGKVRSLFSVLGVFSTALSPMIFGIMLDKGSSFDQLALGCAALLIIISLNSLRVFRIPRVD